MILFRVTHFCRAGDCVQFARSPFFFSPPAFVYGVLPFSPHQADDCPSIFDTPKLEVLVSSLLFFARNLDAAFSSLR